MVDEALMKEVAAIEAKHRQWDATVWADEMTARKYGEVVIQIWDNLRRKADPFQLLGSMPFQEMQLGQAQPTKEWEWDIKAIH